MSILWMPQTMPQPSAISAYFERKGGLDDEEVECDANGLCNGKYGGTTRSVLNNYARGRTLLFTISYKF